MKVDVKQAVSRLIEDTLRAEPYETAEVVISQYKKSVLVRLFVYGEHGVTLDECARLSRSISERLDGAELFDDGYSLEVSSPGLDRPLTQARDYRYRVGETVRLEFVDKKRKRLHGEIAAVSDGSVAFKVDDEVISIDLADIKTAQIVF